MPIIFDKVLKASRTALSALKPTGSIVTLFYAKYFRNREQEKIFGPLFAEVIDKAAIKGVEKHARDEYRGILAAAELIDSKVFSSIVDIASGNGVSQSALWPILQSNPTCVGLCVEVDVRNFSTLATIYTIFPQVALARVKVTPRNVANLLSATDIPQSFDILNLDIDSFDLPVLEAVLRGGWRPKILSMEINEKFPPSIHFAVNYGPEFSWDGGHFYGCSASAAAKLLAEFGYEPVDLRGNNLIAVPQNRIPEDWQTKPITQLYNDGYLNLRRQSGLFAWNSNVDHWQSMDLPDLLVEIRNFFSAYPQDSYELSAASETAEP